MPQYFNFENLIRKYSTTFTAIIPSEGAYDDNGDYVKGADTTVSLTGAIISHRQSKIFRSEGTISEQDRALYMLEPLQNSLQGAKVLFEGNYYRIGNLLENSSFTGVYNYTLKFVSAFNELVEAGDDDD